MQIPAAAMAHAQKELSSLRNTLATLESYRSTLQDRRRETDGKSHSATSLQLDTHLTDPIFQIVVISMEMFKILSGISNFHLFCVPWEPSGGSLAEVDPGWPFTVNTLSLYSTTSPGMPTARLM